MNLKGRHFLKLLDYTPEEIRSLLDMAKARGLTQVYVHCFLDGRDVPPTSGKGYVAEMQQVCQQYGAQIATLSGRYYAKQQRDAILIFGISKQYSLMQINELLDEFHHELLGDFS